MKKVLFVMSIVMLLAVGANAATVFNGGLLTDAANWDNGLPTAADPGIIGVDGNFSAYNVPGWGPMTMNAGTISAAIDWGFGGSALTMNGGTINGIDDVWFNGAVSTINAGTLTAGDDMMANGSGTMIINGGTLTTGDDFGGQSGCSVTLMGGTITAGDVIFDATGLNTIGGSVVTSSATMSGTVVDVLSGWTGSLTVSGMTDWQAYVTSGWTLDGVAIDAASFASNFDVTGQTLTLVPEPATMVLLGLGSLLGLRRKK